MDLVLSSWLAWEASANSNLNTAVSIGMRCFCGSCALSCSTAVFLLVPAANPGAPEGNIVDITLWSRRCRKVCRPRAPTGASLWTACLLRSACLCVAASAAMLERGAPSLDPAPGCQGLAPNFRPLQFLAFPKTYAGLGGLAASKPTSASCSLSTWQIFLKDFPTASVSTMSELQNCCLLGSLGSGQRDADYIEADCERTAVAFAAGGH